MSEFEDFDIQSLFGKNEFSDVLIKFDWDYRKIGVFLKVAETGRKVYAIVNDVRRALSFWKIPEWKSYRDNFKIFSCEEEFQQYFHRNTAEYLPRLVFTERQEDTDLLGKIIETEHEYRQEFLDAGDSMGGTGPLRRTEDTEEYIKVCIDYEDPKNVPPHLVPATQFLCIRTKIISIIIHIT